MTCNLLLDQLISVEGSCFFPLKGRVTFVCDRYVELEFGIKNHFKCNEPGDVKVVGVYTINKNNFVFPSKA